MIRSILIVSVAAVLASAAPAFAMSDATFATKAAIGGNAEVAAGRLAAENGSAKTRSLGERMVTDHTAAGDRLAAIVRGDGMKPSTSIGVAGEAEAAKLKGLHGAAFDGAYIKAQIADHQKMLALLDSEIAGGKDMKLVGWAKSVRPTVAEHLRMFQNASSHSSSM